jgi:hypothetical protein
MQGEQQQRLVVLTQVWQHTVIESDPLLAIFS